MFHEIWQIYLEGNPRKDADNCMKCKGELKIKVSQEIRDKSNIWYLYV